MGIALILLGLVAAGLVVDFAVENWSEGAPELSFAMFGGSFTATQVEVVVGAAALGCAAIALCVLGARLLRTSRGRRRTAKERIAGLERENSELRERPTHPGQTRVPGAVVRVDDREVAESPR
jgi:hypothetical protein